MAKNIYDIKGIYQKELNEMNVKKIGYFFALKVLKKTKDSKYISVGYDARTNSSQLKEWLTVDFPIIKDIITVDGVRVVFENGWRLIRVSKTTPKLLTRFEAINEKTAIKYQNQSINLLQF